MQDWAAWWRQWPLSKWIAEQLGRQWFKEENGRFVANFACAEGLRPAFESMTAELVDYRLAHYAGSRLRGIDAAAGARFVAKVSHTNGKPILFVPGIEKEPGRPTGPTPVQLPDGTVWVFRFVKVACNVAAPRGSDGNQLPDLLRKWFGENAGAPGTGFQVTFARSESGWSAAPVPVVAMAVAASGNEQAVNPHAPALKLVDSPPKAKQFRPLVPVYSLEAAAGLWGPEIEPKVMGWTEIQGLAVQPGMFVARVRGHSMEPKIPDGSWCLFRKCPAGSREGRTVLVQFNSLGDPENGGRFTVKKYHSEKAVTEDSWVHKGIKLLPLNPDYAPIQVDPREASEMIVVGEFLRIV